MNKENETLLTSIIIVGIPAILLIIFIATLPVSLFMAWAVQKLYGWFLLPLHFPHLNIWHVWGIMLLINLLRGDSQADTKTSWQKTIGLIVGRVIVTLMVLLLGLILKGHIHV